MPVAPPPLDETLRARAEGIVLDDAAKSRFSRHLLLPEVGVVGQARLSASRVLVVGAGGLGCPIALYLAAAGVGTLGLVDADVVDTTNLQRQVLYVDADRGRSKVVCASERLRALAPSLVLDLHDARVDAGNVRALVDAYDVIVDGTDSFDTRYLLSDACALAHKPYVYGAIHRFDGQAAVFYPPHGPCYRCLFPTPPAPEDAPSCAEAGVLGVLPGLVGTIQATETLKLLLGRGHVLLDRLLVIDALAMRFLELRVERNPACALCGDAATITEARPIGAGCDSGPPPSVPRVDARQLHAWRMEGTPHGLVDVRTPNEAAIASISGSTNIPMAEVDARAHDLPRDRPIVVYCKSGARSARATRWLRDRGLDARSLDGGILAWIDAFDPQLPRY